MFNWFTKKRRQKLMALPFPSDWEVMIGRNMFHYHMLDDAERQQLQKIIQVFVAEKAWEGCGGLELTDEIRVTISAQACLLLLNIPHNYYQNVETILVYPDDFVLPPRKLGFFENALEPLEPDYPVAGESFDQGPVILVWDAVLQEGRQPEDGYNIVYHEFAHKLDTQDGAADGTPALRSRAEYRDWMKICSDEYLKLVKAVQKGKPTFLDEYGAENEAEFFAVATEHFFSQPVQMTQSAPELYRVLIGFYRQDPAERMKKYLEEAT